MRRIDNFNPTLGLILTPNKSQFRTHIHRFQSYLRSDSDIIIYTGVGEVEVISILP